MARPPDRSDSGGKTGSEELARVVRERRESLGWTRQQLADATGIPYPTIAQIETAYRGVSPSRLGVIARVLDLDPKELYDVLASDVEAVADAASGTPAPGLARGRSSQKFRAAGSWHDNPGFAAAPARQAAIPAAAPVAAPMMAAPSMAASVTEGVAGRAPTNESSPDVVERVVDLVSGLPVDERIAVLSRVQHLVLERILADRRDGTPGRV